MAPIRAAVQATDPLTRAGLTGLLRSSREVTVVPRESTVDVAVVSVQRLGADALAMLRRSAAEVGAPTVLVAHEIADDQALAAVVDCRVVTILSRATATGERLTHSVKAAATGGAILPPVVLGHLLTQLRHLQHERRLLDCAHRAGRPGLTPREIDVLRLAANGLSTDEIAGLLCYSPRTVKKVVSALTRRLALRNRSHAVAYAVRAGLV
jgi:DNA-binding NarL/FixJ family response regulator